MIFAAIFNPLMVGMMVVTKAATMILGAIDPRLAAVLGLAVMLFTMDFSALNFQSILKLTNNMLGVVQKFHQIAFQQEVTDIQEEAKEYAKMASEAQDELDDIKNDAIYIPMGDRISMMYDVTELPYKGTELLAQSLEVPKPWETQYFA
jgi:hypothetical protein